MSNTIKVPDVSTLDGLLYDIREKALRQAEAVQNTPQKEIELSKTNISKALDAVDASIGPDEMSRKKAYGMIVHDYWDVFGTDDPNWFPLIRALQEKYNQKLSVEEMLAMTDEELENYSNRQPTAEP